MNKTRTHICKAIALFLTMAMILSSGVLMIGASAEPAVWDGTTATGFAGGDGSEATPYLISTPAEWAYFAAQVVGGTTYSGEYIKLTADLVFNTGDASGWEETAPANEVLPAGYDGGTSKHFAGIFDGDGHTVFGVYTVQPANTYGYALFGATDGATIKNLRMTNSAFIVKTKGWSGALVGEVLDGKETKIQNVYLDNSVYVFSNQNSVGGIVGGIDSSGSSVSISDSVFAGSVIASGRQQVGGFIGNGNGKVTTLTNCLMLGSVFGTTTQTAGFIGVNNIATISLTGCVYAGSAYGVYPFFQSSKSGCTVSNCYSIVAGNMYKAGSDSSTGVATVSSKDLLGADAAVTIEGWTKRAGDFPVPTGVADMMEDVQIFTFAMLDGASVRLQEPTGIRFSAVISKAYLAQFTNVTEYGIVITPTAYVEKADGVFTMAALEGIDVAAERTKYVKITAEKLAEDTDDYVAFNGVLAEIKAENYGVDFSAIAYIVADGAVYYSAYSADLNSRSIQTVATSALNDLSAEQTEEYAYAVNDMFSPYTEAERTVLEGFID